MKKPPGYIGAKVIPDAAFLEVVQAGRDVDEAWKHLPPKVVRAKTEKMLKRGFIGRNGANGFYVITPSGEDFLSHAEG